VGTAPSSDDVVSGLTVSGTTYTLLNGQDGVTYYCRVRAVDQAGNVGLAGGPTDGIKVDTVAPVCYAPTDGGVWHTGGDMAFTWPDALEAETGVAGYYVSIGTSPGADDVVDDLWVTANTYELASYTEGASYYCKVRAKDQADNVGAFSPPSDGIRADTLGPSAPYPDYTGKWFNSQPHFRWSTSFDNVSGLAGYEFILGTSEYTQDLLSITFMTTNEYTYATATDGRTYWPSVRGVDVAGNRGAWGGLSEGITMDLNPPVAKAVTDQGVWWRLSTLTFRWAASVDALSGVARYLVYVGTSPGAADVVSGVPVVGLNYTLVGALDGVTYYCRIRAVDVAGNVGMDGGESDGIMVDMTPPRVDQAIPWSSWATTSMVHISWDPATDLGSGLKDYIIMVVADNGAKLEKQTTVVDHRNVEIQSGKCQWVLFGLVEGTTYRIYLAASDNAGNVGHAAAAPGVLTVDTVVGTVRTVVDEGAWSRDPVLDFTWSPVVDGTSGVAHYLVYLGTGPNASDVVDGLAVDGTSFRFDAGSDGTTYYLRVAAVDNAGNVGNLSAPTDGVTVDMTPPLSVPVRAPGVWSTRPALTFTWDAPAEGEGIARTYVAVGTAPGSPMSTAVLPRLARSFTYPGGYDGTTYYCWVYFEDAAGNVGEPGAASEGVTVDLTPPTQVSVSAPGRWVPPGPVLFSWTEAHDAVSRVASYDVAIGEAGAPEAVTEGVTTLGLALPVGEAGKIYQCRVRAIDVAGNAGPWSEPSEGVLVYSGAPTVRLLVAGGAAVTGDPMVAFLVSYSDPVGAEAMRLSESPTFEGSAWEPFRGTGVLMLERTDGPHTVRVQVRNGVGVVGDGNATIVLDTVAPIVSIDTVDGTKTRDGKYDVLGRVDPGIVVTYNGRPVAVGADGTFSMRVNLVLGANPVRFVATDAAGNVGDAAITLYREPVPPKDWTPVAVGFSIGAFLVALAVLGLVIYYFAKKRALVSWEEEK